MTSRSNNINNHFHDKSCCTLIYGTHYFADISPNIHYTLYQPRLSYIELAPTVFIISMSLNIILALHLSEKKSEIPAAWLFWSGLWEIMAV